MFCGTVETVQASKRRRVDFGSWRDASHSRTNQTDVTATTPSKIRLRAIDYILDKVDNAAKMHSVVLNSYPRLQMVWGKPTRFAPKDQHGTVECLASSHDAGAWQHGSTSCRFALTLKVMSSSIRCYGPHINAFLLLLSHYFQHLLQLSH
jgi:hypothetical protein